MRDRESFPAATKVISSVILSGYTQGHRFPSYGREKIILDTNQCSLNYFGVYSIDLFEQNLSVLILN